MIPLLAQTTEPISVQTIGTAVLVIILLSRWLWDFLKHRREEAAQLEPRADPPLHRQYVDRETFSKELTNVHGRIGRERGEVNQELAELREGLERISSDGEQRDIRIHDRIDKLATEVGETPRKTVELLRTTKGLL
ncbi:hypothetical protein AW736_13855 [Termitidicoccus mucosus]|uniref:Uncharacterized protein n=2 Tax=Termitidicoccus mucosus TaxID=1184151 RepID=A0A178II70_9BACT|nr:hypothetical protein AW736_13855 [Opitutaceae bacterium TSB47]